MSRSISRPFGRADQPAAVQRADGPMPSVTEFVLQDTAGDTPHDIHPHAAAWATTQGNPMDQAPMRISTGSGHNAPGRPRPATAEERAAYIKMRNARMQQEQAQAPGLAPEQAAPQPPADAPYSPPLATYAMTATAVDPSFRVPATASYEALQPASQTTDLSPRTPANPPAPRTPSPAPSDASLLDPAVTQPPASPRLGSPLQLTPPKRTSSLVVPARAPVPEAPGPAELEITYTSPTGRTVTVRLFAP